MATTAALALQPHVRLQPGTVPPGPRRPVRRLRVIEGGRGSSALARRARYRRRRLVLATALVALAAAVWLLAGAALAGITGDGTPSAVAGGASPTPAAATGAAGVAADHQGGTHLVRPGDTLWSIAEAAAPGVDVRITVDRLVQLNGGAQIAVGQRLLLP